jgi:hypothetical protein
VTTTLAALIVDESKWLTASMAVAFVAAAVLLHRRRTNATGRATIATAMSLCFALTVGTMAFGHLLAVTTKLALGTLAGSMARLYLIGIVLAIPSAWLLARVRRALAAPGETPASLIAPNAAVAAALVVMGLHNLPLAAPGLVNVAYLLHARRAVGWTLVGLALAINAGLFAGSLVFMASGQSFEQFSGIE